MSSKRQRHLRSVVGAVLAIIGATATPSALANVYATNIKLNGGLGNVSVPAGGKVNISYILNDTADGGVVIKILSGATVVRTINVPGSDPGATPGLHTNLWDGLDSSSNALPSGSYSVSITAASAGYPSWTQFSDDTSDATWVWDGRGIAVDRNPTSRYYGRIFVGNSHSNDVFGASLPGDYVGFQKLNADGSPADEGIFSDGGYHWAGDEASPWHIEVSDDDYVYISDWTSNGVVIRWDPTLSTNSMQLVLRPDNWLITSNADGTFTTNNLGGPALFGAGVNSQVWMADDNPTNSRGVVRYKLTAGGTIATNDTGTSVVAVSGGTNLSTGSYDVALDKAGNIYTVVAITATGDPSERVFRFPAYDPSTNGLAPETNATWAVGASDDTYTYGSGIAVDPSGTYVAVSFRAPLGSANGNTRILYASNGVEVVNLDLGIDIGGSSQHDDTDCAWDAVGNVYYIDNFFPSWRAVSPPGTNQATTLALDQIQVVGGGTTSQIVITNITVAGGMVTLTFAASGNATPSAFTVLSSPRPDAGYGSVAGATVTGASGVFQATFPAAGNNQFYRIQAGGGGGPTNSQLKFSSISRSAGSVILNFTSLATDNAAMFTILSSPNVATGYSVAPGASVTGSGGTFQATVPASAAIQFYRIQK